MNEIHRKLEDRGAEALTDAELLSIIMRCDLEKAESLCRDAVVESPKDARLKAVLEFGRRQKLDPRPIIDCARAAAGIIPQEVRAAKKEHFVVLVLNARRQLIHQETVSIGTLSASLVHPREVFTSAISKAGAAIVAIHNHPSGDTTPSAEDREVTRRLSRAGELLGIPLADHVVVSETGFYSFREHGLL